MNASRRAHLRIPSTTRVDWRVRDTCTHYVSTVRDWSRDAVFIDTALPKHTGDVISMRMDVQGIPVHFEGVVVRHCPDGMAVRLDASSTRFL